MSPIAPLSSALRAPEKCFDLVDEGIRLLGGPTAVVRRQSIAEIVGGKPKLLDLIQRASASRIDPARCNEILTERRNQTAVRLDGRQRADVFGKRHQRGTSRVEHRVVCAIAGPLGITVLEKHPRARQGSPSLSHEGRGTVGRLVHTRTPSRQIASMSAGLLNATRRSSSSSQSGSGSTSTPVSIRTSNAIPAISRDAERRSPEEPASTTAKSASLSA
ncbi:hypothetical protein OFEAOIEE_LOCUS908 [Methylorubrum extorquens]